MGNIVKNEEDSNYLCQLVLDIKDNGFDANKIIGVLERLLPRDSNGKLLIKHRVTEKGMNTAIFLPRYEKIEISVNKIDIWLEKNADDLAPMFEIEDKELLKAYLLLMALMHETEHSYQYLIGLGLVPAPCLIIRDAYHALFDLLLPKEYILPRPIKQARRAISVVTYKMKENEYLLERNAQFDSLSTLSNVAFYNGHNDIRNLLLNLKNAYAISGYLDNSDGPLVNTFKNIVMGDKLKKMNHDYSNLDMMDRYRLGLPVDDVTHERILALRK